MNMCKYCKDHGMNKSEYDNFKNNIVEVAKAIRSQLVYKGGMYYNVNELFTWNVNEDIKGFIINELKKMDIEFFNDCTEYRVCE